MNFVAMGVNEIRCSRDVARGQTDGHLHNGILGLYHDSENISVPRVRRGVAVGRVNSLNSPALTNESNAGSFDCT